LASLEERRISVTQLPQMAGIVFQGVGLVCLREEMPSVIYSQFLSL
jgi:hypothetical protein